jgi:polysaccharide export outer membrane protein
LRYLNFLFLAVLPLFLTSCGSNMECCYCLHCVDEFVTDSYKIRQGKLSIVEMTGHELAEVPCNAMEEFEDVICEDDVLSVTVYHPSRKDLMEAIEGINKYVGFRVYQGHIDLPDMPPVVVAGLTLQEAHDVLTKNYQEHVKGIEVFINYKERPSHKVELAGLVAVTSIPVNGKIRLFEVLSEAKIPTTANLFMSYVTRCGCPLAIDLHRLLTEGDMTYNIVMRPGDKIYIADARDAVVTVMGEVGCPKAVNLYYGFISLREALVAAGGIPYTGDRHRIQVIRGGTLCPKVYELNWCHITQLPNESLLLMPGDTVYVLETPITRWNRWISQLLPSMNCFQTGMGCYKIFMN